MHSAALRYFAVVARAGSIRRASEELNVAASAVSRQVQKIEYELGLPLFERLPDGLRLTEAGRHVLQHAEHTLHNYELLKGHIGEMKGLRTGVVSIAALDSLVVRFLPSLIDRYHKQHPAMNYRLRSTTHGTIAQMVADGEADIGVTFDLPHPEDLGFVHDVPMPLMAMVSAGHPLARQKSVSLLDCTQFNLLLQLDTLAIQSLIEVELSVLQRSGRVLMASNNLLMLKHMVLKGQGVAFYTPLGMMEEIEDGRIVPVPLSGTRLGGMRMGLLVPRRRKLTPAVQDVIERIGAELKALRLPGQAAPA